MAEEWAPPPPSGTPDKVPNYLIPAIISAVCCLPLGIISIVFAAQVNGKVERGDIAGAMIASKRAKICTIIFISLGIVFWGLQVISWFGIIGLSILSNS